MSPNFHTGELTILAELAMKQSLRCERAAESINDSSLAVRLSALSRARILLRLELEARLRATGGVPVSQSAGSGGLNGLRAAQRMDLLPDGQSLLRQVAAAEDELYAAMLASRALGELDPATRLGSIIDRMVEERRALGSTLDAVDDIGDDTARYPEAAEVGNLTGSTMSGPSSMAGLGRRSRTADHVPLRK